MCVAEFKISSNMFAHCLTLFYELESESVFTIFKPEDEIKLLVYNQSFLI
jgi:hypothetical protein